MCILGCSKEPSQVLFSTHNSVWVGRSGWARPKLLYNFILTLMINTFCIGFNDSCMIKNNLLFKSKPKSITPLDSLVTSTQSIILHLHIYMNYKIPVWQMNNPLAMAFQQYPDRIQQQLVAHSSVLHPDRRLPKMHFFQLFYEKTQFIYLVGLRVICFA